MVDRAEKWTKESVSRKMVERLKDLRSRMRAERAIIHVLPMLKTISRSAREVWK